MRVEWQAWSNQYVKALCTKTVTWDDHSNSFISIAYLPNEAPVLELKREYPEIVTAVSYGKPYEHHHEGISTFCHVSKTWQADASRDGLKRIWRYPEADDFFVLPAHDTYRSNSAAVAHTRTLSFVKPLLDGPYFDLEAIWDEHTRFEFTERSVDATMVRRSCSSRCS